MQEIHFLAIKLQWKKNRHKCESRPFQFPCEFSRSALIGKLTRVHARVEFRSGIDWNCIFDNAKQLFILGFHQTWQFHNVRALINKHFDGSTPSIRHAKCTWGFLRRSVYKVCKYLHDRALFARLLSPNYLFIRLIWALPEINGIFDYVRVCAADRIWWPEGLKLYL